MDCTCCCTWTLDSQRCCCTVQHCTECVAILVVTHTRRVQPHCTINTTKVQMVTEPALVVRNLHIPSHFVHRSRAPTYLHITRVLVLLQPAILLCIEMPDRTSVRAIRIEGISTAGTYPLRRLPENEHGRSQPWASLRLVTAERHH